MRPSSQRPYRKPDERVRKPAHQNSEVRDRVDETANMSSGWTGLSGQASPFNPSRFAAYQYGASGTSVSDPYGPMSHAGPSVPSSWAPIAGSPYKISVWMPNPAATSNSSTTFNQNWNQTSSNYPPFSTPTEAGPSLYPNYPSLSTPTEASLSLYPDPEGYYNSLSSAPAYPIYSPAPTPSAYAPYSPPDTGLLLQTSPSENVPAPDHVLDSRSYDGDYANLVSPSPERAASPPPPDIVISPLRARPSAFQGLLESIERDETPSPAAPEVERYANPRANRSAYGKEYVQITEDELHQIRPDYGKMKRLVGFVNAEKGIRSKKGKGRKNVHLTFVEQRALNTLRIKAGRPALMRVKRSREDQADWDKAAKVRNAELESKLDQEREEIREMEMMEEAADEGEFGDEAWGAEWR
ncbi:uncharacterized protein L3040_003050 [Drepanopeziza brunnea f. sp. 'multigermtubi']|uniref:Uncharacterized protein n=1 Tax=Marssonina brunnea f. sp. multigermtubi (strain MB_m1) TaxID=1072389 RepID=K1XLC2_MARBU|nr:uncharacterized protein MBM_08692 [Drepanopeziza brunnea f. sp. 'multigermtubi' MB_m1]EKD13249.1 hypothetical protein MBM_08692 [Drepanopeziza brunnea f. sp. 'multigermtubi' MB_m1]KAJ5047209.1 hypothetical protein L3040_003050 [Drepanopeziza brunnea f. sp. 'multigermtubi']